MRWVLRPPAVKPSESAPRYRHRAREGETLAAIAARYQVTSQALASENALESDAPMEPGTELLIPVTGRLTHRVQPGETLSHLAVWYQVPVVVLARANQIEEPRRLSVGAELWIPHEAAQVPLNPPALQQRLEAPRSEALRGAQALVERGESRYRAADFEAALDNALRAQQRAARAPATAPRDSVLARAALLEGMTQTALGLGEAARSSFVRALRFDAQLELDPRSTSPKILLIFRAAQQELDS